MSLFKLTMLKYNINRCHDRSECSEPFRNMTDEHKFNAHAELLIHAYNYPNCRRKTLRCPIISRVIYM